MPSKAILLYLTTDGKFGYIIESQFPNGAYKYLIDQNFSSTSRIFFSVSQDQNYVAIASHGNFSVFIYSLVNYALTCSYNLPISGAGALSWMLDNQTVLISSLQ